MNSGAWTKRLVTVAVFVAVGIPIGDAAAQCEEWTLTNAPGPSPRQNHATAHDGQSIVLFGGFRGGVGYNAETWLWDGAAWTRADVPGPSARSVHKMAPLGEGKVILFGGSDGTAKDDTWQWDADTKSWAELFPEHKPAARFNHAMAYDAARGRIVLFGGFGAQRYADTWAFDGDDWTQLSPNTSPSGRNGHAMVYDSARQVVVLFGGFPGWTNDTWEWNGEDWTQIQVAGPPGRQYFGMTYHEALGVTIMSCGQLAGFVRAEDTWTYDGAAWTQLEVGVPGIRDQHVLDYLAGRNQVVLHGGYAGGNNVLEDTWTLACSRGCAYTVRKDSKGKKGCTDCPAKGEEWSTGAECEDLKDCDRKIKLKRAACPDGGLGFCNKIVGKRIACR